MDINIPNQSQQVKDKKTLGKAVSFSSDGEIRSRHYEDEWDFSGSTVRANGKSSIVSFSKANPVYKRAIQDTLNDLLVFFKDRDQQTPTVTQLRAWKIGLQHIAKALASTDWCEIDSRQGLKRLKKGLKKMNLGRETIESSVINALNRLFESGVLENIIDGRALVALGKPKRARQHVAIPIGMYQKLLSRAISIVETYHPYRYEIARVTREAYEIKTQVESGINVLAENKGVSSSVIFSDSKETAYARASRACNKIIKHDIPDFVFDFRGSQLGQLQNSCAIVLLAFSGVRVGEMVSFNMDSYSTKKTDKGKSISVLQGKKSKGEGGIAKAESWQTHPIAKDALELAYEMVEPLRDIYKVKIESLLETGEFDFDKSQHAMQELDSAFIPLFVMSQKHNFSSTGFAKKFNKLMKHFELKATQEDVEEFNLLNPSREGALKVGGYLPKLTPHDFRRTFAVFFKRYGFGTASGIKFQYKHENINMSDYYANNADLMQMNDVLMDSDLLQIMEEEGIKLGVDIYDEIYNGSEHLSGVGGERIAQDKFKRMKAGQDVYMKKSEIESLVRNGSLSVVNLPTGGYCTNSACERVCGMGLFIGEKKKCIHVVNTDRTAKEDARQRKRLINVFNGLNTGDSVWNSILVGIKQKIKEIESLLIKHEVKFDNFEGVIVGIK